MYIMAHSWHIAGHKRQTEFLSKSVDSGNIAHAYIFSGPEMIGKNTVAKNFAQILICENKTACNNCALCNSYNRSSNPDIISVQQDETIKIEQIRQLIYKLSLKPYVSKFKVAIIDNAENITTEAANALLKSLEEPKPNTVIILITANPYRILPTILSRAQRISFGLVEPVDSENLLPSDLSPEQREAIKSFAYGRPGLALKISKSQDELNNLLTLNEQYHGFLEGDLVDRLKLATDLAEAETVQLKTTFQFWLTSLERNFLNDPNKNLAKKINLVSKSIEFLEAKVNQKLLLTQLMVDC